jgi:NADH-quinone oxidoreductase subunit G
MPKLEIDGRTSEVANGATIMDAANALGIYIPHFCYHPKLSIAANCRMCLVQVEKTPKPMPACATPATEGMKVYTRSEYAKDAQRGVMEFLLINHPLDCPICDQGGECQLQDLAVGYGASSSRYDEPKRVVFHKGMGPLISAEEMTRCIHCTRCVRFGQEVAGIMELGMVGRGEHAEIVSFVGRTVNSELSGNMIDVCPVGALTSKPFRYTARNWELAQRKSISPHDSLGSNLIVQVKANRVMRVLPLENEAVNECWLSDKDRFSYEGLNADRLTKPMIRQGGGWREADWQQALDYTAEGLRKAGAAIGALGSPHATVEELYLLAKLVRALGSENVDFRLRRSDFSADGKRAGVPWLGMPITELANLDRVLVIGSFLRKDHPLLAHRFRQAAKRSQQVSLLHMADDDALIKWTAKAIVAPSELADAIAQLIAGVRSERAGQGATAAHASDTGAALRSIARSLASGKNIGVFLGNAAEQHPQATQLHALALSLSEALGARLGFFGEAANSVGGYLADCVPGARGLNARSMLAEPQQAYVLLNVEPELDCHNPREAMAAMKAAPFVVALSPYASSAADYADVLLPIGPFSETAGSFVNTEGRMQSFNYVAKPLAEARPAWKVLRVLADTLKLPGFDFDTSEEVRDACCTPEAVAARLDNRLEGAPAEARATATVDGSFERVTDVPIYFTDPIVRRAPSLQKTADATAPRALMSSAAMRRAGVAAGDTVRIRQEGAEVVLEAALDERVPAGCVRIAAGHPRTAGLGAMFGTVTVERS